MESIYWVLSRDCNQRCPHCYNNSGPGAPGLEISDVAKCVANLPDPGSVPVGRIILSGGEVLVWPELLFHTLHELRDTDPVRPLSFCSWRICWLHHPVPFSGLSKITGTSTLRSVG